MIGRDARVGVDAHDLGLGARSGFAGQGREGRGKLRGEVGDIEDLPGGRAAVGSDRTNERTGVVPRAPLVEEDVLAAAEVLAGADRLLAAEDLILGKGPFCDGAVGGGFGTGFHGELDAVGDGDAGRVADVGVVADVVGAVVAELEEDEAIPFVAAREGVAVVELEGVFRDDVSGDAAKVAGDTGELEEAAVVVPPEVDAGLVVEEGVPEDPVVGAVLHVDGPALEAIGEPAVPGELVLGDEGVGRVAAPDAADGILNEPVLREDVALAEGHLDAVGGGVGEIISDEEIPVGAEGGELAGDFCGNLDEGIHVLLAGLAAESGALFLHPEFTEGFAAGETEEAVAAMGGGVLGDGVLVALLEGEDAGGILAAVVDAFGMAADAEVEGVSGDDVPAAAPEGEAPTGEEGGVVVVDP